MFQHSRLYYLIYGATFILLVIAVVFGIKFIVNLSQERKNVETPVQKNAPLDDATVIEKVGKHMVLPYEQPKVVTVANVDDLRLEQPFFLQAKNGDKLLVYSTRVILYNPDLDKIVDIAQIRIDTTPASPIGGPTPQ